MSVKYSAVKNKRSSKSPWTNRCLVCLKSKIVYIQCERSKRGYKCDSCRASLNHLRKRIVALNKLRIIAEKLGVVTQESTEVSLYQLKVRKKERAVLRHIEDLLDLGYEGYKILPKEAIQFLHSMGHLPSDQYDLLEKAEDCL